MTNKIKASWYDTCYSKSNMARLRNIRIRSVQNFNSELHPIFNLLEDMIYQQESIMYDLIQRLQSKGIDLISELGPI